MFELIAIALLTGLAIFANRRRKSEKLPRGYRPNIPSTVLGDNPLDFGPRFPHDIIIRKEARRFKVPVRLMVAIAEVESAFNANAVNLELKADKRKGINVDSIGLFQILWPTTALALAKKEGVEVTRDKLFDPELNSFLAGSLCEGLLQRFPPRVEFPYDAVAAYNAGKPRFNPDGSYRNQSYVNKVRKSWDKWAGVR